MVNAFLRYFFALEQCVPSFVSMGLDADDCVMLAFLLTVLFSPYTAEYTPQTFNFAIVIFTGVVSPPPSFPATRRVLTCSSI